MVKPEPAHPREHAAGERHADAQLHLERQRPGERHQPGERDGPFVCTNRFKDAAGYLRVSGKGQVEGDGFIRQLKAIKEYAATHGMKIVNVYREEGVSGTKESADRPAWSELMTALHSNGVKVVIVERLDRLARDLMVQETIVADLRKYGFELVRAEEPSTWKSGNCRAPSVTSGLRCGRRCASWKSEKRWAGHYHRRRSGACWTWLARNRRRIAHKHSRRSSESRS